MQRPEELLRLLPLIDWVGLACFIAAWAGYAIFARRRSHTRPSFLASSNRVRWRWMRQSTYREVRVLDGVVVQLQSSTASFFASTTILIIGALVAVLGATERASDLVRDLPFVARTSALVFDLKVVVLAAIFIYAFFRFTWSLRQYTFGALVVAAAPAAERFTTDAERDAFAEAEPARVQRGIMDAIIGGEAGDDDPLESALLQIAGEPGRRRAIRFEEGRIAVDRLVMPFAQHEMGLLDPQPVGEPGALRSLDAMVRPQHLRAVGHLDQREGLGAGMVRREGRMVRRMPVLRQHHGREIAHQPVDPADDFIPARHGQGTAGAEVVLHVDHDQRFIRGFHRRPPSFTLLG